MYLKKDRGIPDEAGKITVGVVTQLTFSCRREQHIMNEFCEFADRFAENVFYSRIAEKMQNWPFVSIFTQFVIILNLFNDAQTFNVQFKHSKYEAYNKTIFF